MSGIQQAKTKDMTAGSPLKLILRFAIPVMLGTLFQQFYSMVDTIIVGKILGVDALAGVGSTGSINFMIVGFCTGVCSGFSVPVAQKFGAGDHRGLRRFVANSVWLSLIFAGVLTIAVTLLTDDILWLMNTPEEIFSYAYRYIVIIFAGIPMVYLYNLTAGIIRAMGDSKTPLYFLMMSSGLNIVLDLFCIIVLKMGVAGAGVATVVSQFISGGSCLLYMRRKYSILKMDKGDWKIRPPYMARLCSMGLPMGLQISVTAIGSVVLQAAINGLGYVTVAAVTAAQKVNLFIGCPGESLGIAMSTYTGQNVGAGKMERIQKGFHAAAVIGCVYALFAFCVQLVAGRQLAMLFLDSAETAMIDQARKFMLCSSAFYIPLMFVNVVRSMIQGMGFGFLSIFSGVSEMIARAAVGFLLVPRFGFIAACFAHPAAWVAADIFLFPAFVCCKKRLKERMREREENADSAQRIGETREDKECVK